MATRRTDLRLRDRAAAVARTAWYAPLDPIVWQRRRTEGRTAVLLRREGTLDCADLVTLRDAGR